MASPSHTDLAQQKHLLRKNALGARAMMAHAAGPLAGQRLAQRVLALLKDLPTGGVIAGYVPVRGEIDVMPLLEKLHEKGRILVLPVVAKRNAPLIFRRWRPGEALSEGAFGVPVPEAGSEEMEPDIVLVPLAAFDRAGHRLGYGGGYYDRTLEYLRARRPMTAIGMAYSGQELDALPCDDKDQRLDWIVTDRETIRTQARRDAPGA